AILFRLEQNMLSPCSYSSSSLELGPRGSGPVWSGSKVRRIPIQTDPIVKSFGLRQSLVNPGYATQPGCGANCYCRCLTTEIYVGAARTDCLSAMKEQMRLCRISWALRIAVSIEPAVA